MIKKIIKYTPIIWAIVIILYFTSWFFYNEIFVQPGVSKWRKEVELTFDTSEIKGRLLHVVKEIHGTNPFTTANDPDLTYDVRLVPINEANEPFEFFAHAGDSVAKNRNSDTLILFKGTKAYYYKAFYNYLH
jgi:hypothetical protein